MYDGSEVIAELDAAGVVLRRYARGAEADEPLVWYEGSGTADPRYLARDERGSVTAATDGSGSVIGRNAYDEHGIPSAGNEGPFGYTGQMWLPEVGAWHYKARVYSPYLGRFLQPHPIGTADGLNLYAYVGGDAVNATDPSGLLRELCIRGQGQTIYHEDGTIEIIAGEKTCYLLPEDNGFEDAGLLPPIFVIDGFDSSDGSNNRLPDDWKPRYCSAIGYKAADSASDAADTMKTIGGVMVIGGAIASSTGVGAVEGAPTAGVGASMYGFGLGVSAVSEFGKVEAGGDPGAWAANSISSIAGFIKNSLDMLLGDQAIGTVGKMYPDPCT